MNEITGDLWDYYDREGYFIIITTNGTLRKDGSAVMGRGCAAEAKQKLPDMARLLGEDIRRHGNILLQPYRRDSKCPEFRVLTFPVKHNWWEKADMELIKESARQLSEFIEGLPKFKFVLPRPGCGNGRLDWEIVKPLLKELPGRVLVISR